MKPYFETKLGRLWHGDCMEWLEKAHISTIDLLLTDPPYGLNKKMTGGTWGKNYKDGDMLEWDYVLKQEYFDRLLKIGKKQIIFGANNYIVPPSRCWIVWVKPQIPTLSDVELAWTNIDFPAKAYTNNRMLKEKLGGHPTVKPIGLMEYCITFSKTDGIVLDPFLGSGTTAIACERLNRKWIGIEISEKYCEIAAKRIESEASQLKMFA